MDSALADVKAAIKLDPDGPEGFYIRGRIYAGQTQWKDAVADYTEAIQQDPKFGWAYARRAAAYDATGQTDSAKADRAKAKELGPGGGRNTDRPKAEPRTVRPIGFAADARQRPVLPPPLLDYGLVVFRRSRA